MRYRDDTAFRQALSDHLRKDHPGEDLNRLLKRATMERLLARIATTLGDRALLKGGYALELRLAHARATQDLDLAIRALPADEILEALRDAAATKADDHLTFRIERTSRAMADGAPHGGRRLTVVPNLGGRRFMPFPLDVGVGDALPAHHDVLRGGIDLAFAGLAPLEVHAIPVEVHLAEKLHALSRPRTQGRPNSRVKDLVDVMLLMRDELPSAAVMRQAVHATFETRATHRLPHHIPVPVERWRGQYERFAHALELAPEAATIEEADARLRKLLRVVHSDAATP